MLESIVITALTLHFSFAALGITPQAGKAVEDVVRFALDYTFWLNLLMVLVAGWMVYLHRAHLREHSGGMKMEMGGGGKLKRRSAHASLLLVFGGLVSLLVV